MTKTFKIDKDQVRLKDLEIEKLKEDHNLMIEKLKQEHKLATDQGKTHSSYKFSIINC